MEPTSTHAPVTTTTADTVQLFVTGAKARRELNRWRDRAPQAIQELVRGHVTAAAYRLTPADLLAVAASTDHALGDADKINFEKCVQMRDFYAPLAFTYAFHYLLEKRGALFTWREWVEAYHSDPIIREFMAEPAAEAIAAARLDPDQARSEEAWWWRMGLAYYSFLRELFVLVGARKAGFDVRMHPLADVLFRVDAWLGDGAISLFVANGKFKQGMGGRKQRPQHFLYDSVRPWTYHHLEFGSTPAFGRVYYPDPLDVITAMNRVVPSHLQRIPA